MTLGVRKMAESVRRAPSLISRYKGRGMPMDSAEGALKWMRENVRDDPRFPRDDGDGQEDEAEEAADYKKSRARREAAEAEIAELKLLELRGDLVRLAVVRAAVSRRAAAMRESFMQLPARVVPLLVADPSAANMDRLIRAEIAAALDQLNEQQ